VTNALLHGVAVRPLRRIDDQRGSLLQMLRMDDPGFERFGEVYFSSVRPRAVKAWRRHRRTTSNLAVPVGTVRLVLYDERPGSPTEGQTMILEVGELNYILVTIPPGLWTGWQWLGGECALVANCATEPHDDAEVEREDSESARIPYRWER
jgi:dTDP-4-dehydrorhamnose 3,5-epimerase